MIMTLRPLIAADQPRLLPVLARYLAEIAPGAAINVSQKASRSLNRQDMQAVWICANNTEIGFAFVLTLPEGQRELSEFTIFPNMRRRGYGQAAVTALLTASPGRWRLGISQHSLQAAGFWGTCLSLVPGVTDLQTGAPFTTHQCNSYSFTIAPHSDAGDLIWCPPHPGARQGEAP